MQTKTKSRRRGLKWATAIVGVKRSNDSQKWLIYELIRHHGGLAKITRKCAELLGDPEFSIQNFSNWRRRGMVPIEYAIRLGDKLGVSAHALNYKDATRALGQNGSWKQTVDKCKIFDKKLKAEILSHKEPQ